MKCLNCNVTLFIAERHNVEIDYCPECRDVWPEREKLDKIIEKGTPAAVPWRQQQPEHYPDAHGHDHEHEHGRYGSHGKRRLRLSDLFD